MRCGWRPWLSTMATNAAIALLVVTTMWFVGVATVPARASADRAARRLDRRLAVLRPAPIRGYVLGGDAPGTCTRRRCMAARTTICRLSCAGSPPISAFTMSIICAAAFPTIGCRACLRDHPELRGAGRLTLLQSFACVRLALWDETQQRLISFRDCAPPGVRATRTADHQACVLAAAHDGGPSQ